MTKSFIPVLAIFLVVLVAFAALQIVGILTKDEIPAPTQKQMEALDPTLNTKIIDDLKKLPAN